MDNRHANRQLIITRVGTALCGIDIEDVHEIIPVPAITSVPKSPVNMLGVIDVRGVVVPVADLRACLGFPPSPFTHDTRIVLVNYHDEKIGLIVDAVSEVTTLPPGDFQTMQNSHGDSVFLRAVARFQGRLVLEIDHVRVVDDRLNADVPPSVDAGLELERIAEDALGTAPPASDGAAAEDDGSLNIELIESSYRAAGAERRAARGAVLRASVRDRARGAHPLPR